LDSAVAFVYNVLGVPLAAGVLYPSRAAAQPHDRRRGDESQFSVGDRERLTASQRTDLMTVDTAEFWLKVYGVFSAHA
jgi:hypothetical protein